MITYNQGLIHRVITNSQTHTKGIQKQLKAYRSKTKSNHKNDQKNHENTEKVNQFEIMQCVSTVRRQKNCTK